MSSNPDDVSNNPYNEGRGASSSPPRQSSNWFCHSCQRDFNSSELLHTPDPTCPHCHGDFVEETGESLDDPHDFDRPVFPFPPFLAHPPGQNEPDDGQHADHGQPGQQRPAGQPQFLFVPAAGQAAGPFGMLFSAMSQAMQQPQQGQNHPHRPASGPPLSPEEAASRAAERRAAGLAPETAGSSSSHVSHESAADPGSSNQPPNPPSATGVYRSDPATFVWTTGGPRPPPASYPSSPRQQHQHLPAQTPAQQQAQQQQQQPQSGNQGHVRNLASFLQEAFTGGQHQSGNAAGQQQQQGAANSQAETAPQTGQAEGHHSDPLMHMLGGLANMFGLPIQSMTAGAQQGQQQQQQQQTGSTAGPGNDQHGQAPGQGDTQGTRTHTFSYGTPGQGTRIVFTFGGPPGDNAAGPIPPAFLPFMMGMGGEDAMPGQMGDYVFSQGALDNIITELMNQAQGRYGPQPAPEDVINNLPTFKMTKELLSSDTVNECAVCKDEFAEEEDIMELPCNHIFHVDCIKPWLERSGTCPICRHQLVPQPEPPTAPGQEGNATQTGTQTAPGQAGRRPPFRQDSNPASPSLPRSPPIAEGSSMPGSFPFGNIFSALGNFVTGHSGDTSTTNPTSSNPSTREATAARSSGDTNNMASTEQRNQDQQNQQQQQQGQTQTSTRREQQGQPDLDLDLD